MKESDFGPWIGWNGGECPVDGDETVNICTRNAGVQAIQYSVHAHHYNWRHGGPRYPDIIAYRVRLKLEIRSAVLYVEDEKGCMTKLHHATIQVYDNKPDFSTLSWEEDE